MSLLRAVLDYEARFTAWVGHRAFPVSILASVFVVATEFGDVYDPVESFTGIIATVLFLVAAVVSATHSCLPCDACAEEIPLNGPEQAAERQQRMIWHHRACSWPFVVASIAAYLVVRQLRLDHESLGLALVFDGTAFVVIVPRLYLQRVHRPVMAWCDRCVEGGDGPRKEPSPVLPPDPSVTHTR